MARDNLPTNFVNYELATSMGGMRRFTQIDNSDGTVSFEDATTYSTTGTTYGADEINTANELINEINELVGTTSISGSGQTDITSLLGGTDISESTLGIGDGTVTGAISELNSNLTNLTIYHTFSTITTGTLGYEDINYPSGYTLDNIFVERFEINYDGWRGGENVSGSRCFYQLLSDKIRLYCNFSVITGIRMTISKRTTTDVTL